MNTAELLACAPARYRAYWRERVQEVSGERQRTYRCGHCIAFMGGYCGHPDRMLSGEAQEPVRARQRACVLFAWRRGGVLV